MYIFVPVAEDRGGKADTLKSSAKNLYADIIPAQPRVFNSWTNLSFTWPEMVIPLKKNPNGFSPQIAIWEKFTINKPLQYQTHAHDRTNHTLTSKNY